MTRFETVCAQYISSIQSQARDKCWELSLLTSNRSWVAVVFLYFRRRISDHSYSWPAIRMTSIVRRKKKTSSDNFVMNKAKSWNNWLRHNSSKSGAIMIPMVRIPVNLEKSSNEFLPEIGNGYIEGHELDDLLRELASSVNINDAGPEVSWAFLFVVEWLIRVASSWYQILSWKNWKRAFSKPTTRTTMVASKSAKSVCPSAASRSFFFSFCLVSRDSSDWGEFPSSLS